MQDENKLAKVFFGRMEAVKDYNKAMKLYKKYNGLIESMKDEKADRIRPELLRLIGNASEGMDRIYRIYKGAYEDTEKLKQQDKIAYSDTQRKAYFDEIARMNTEIQTMKEKINPKGNVNAT